jgi:hypothetical protein
MCCCRCWRPDYSSSHKDWSCWAGLHPPSKADALCAIPSRAPRLCASDRLTRRRGGAERARRSCKVCQTELHPSLETSASRATSRRRRGGHGMPCPHTRRWKWAPRATQQTRTRVNVSENCYKCTVETQSAQRFLAIARCVLCREVGEDRASNWYAPRAVGLMEIVKSAPCTVGLMKIEHLFRSTAPAVGLMEIEN